MGKALELGRRMTSMEEKRSLQLNTHATLDAGEKVAMEQRGKSLLSQLREASGSMGLLTGVGMFAQR